MCERQIELDGNISLYSVGEEVIDKDGAVCKIVEKARNSICVLVKKKTDKGIDALNWIYIKDFEKRFKKQSTNL